jgi:anti-sigma regulatory factor (Ser/Thr protein kinase)
MRAERRFALDARSPGAARRFVHDALSGHLTSARLDDVVLATSELVTNAVLHAGTPLTVVVDADEDGGAYRWVRVSVADGDPDPPVLQPADTEAITGRGLLIVEALCERWGYGPRPDHEPGKQVWAQLETSRHDGSR